MTKTRYVDLKGFTIIIQRLSTKVNADQISCMFQLIGERKIFGSQDVFMLDLWVFLALLKHAEEEDRRSFDFKHSRISNDVAFWSNQNKNENENPATNNHKRRSPKKARPVSAIDIDRNVNKKRSIKEIHNSVAEAFGSPIRVNHAKETQGKYVHGCFQREREAVGTSVAEALHVAKRPEKANRAPRKANDSILFGDEIIPLGHMNKDTEKLTPSNMTGLMTAGVGVSRAIYGRSMTPNGRSRDNNYIDSNRSTSMGSLQWSNAQRATTVSEALGGSLFDSRGRPGTTEGIDARRKVSTLGKPPNIL